MNCVTEGGDQYKMLAVQVRLLLLAALAGEHILYIGPPGTAKSELGRRLARLYKGSFFERLLTRFSVPEVASQPVNTLNYRSAMGHWQGSRSPPGWCMHVCRCVSTAVVKHACQLLFFPLYKGLL